MLNYYKVLENGMVVDVNCVFLRYAPKRGTLLVCGPAEAQLIQASDQSAVWRTDWLNPLPEDVAARYEWVEAVEIGEDEYTRLRELLDAGEEMEPPETDTEESPAAELPQVEVTVVDNKNTLRRCAELEEKLAFLEGCILEMSEDVYG